MWVVICINVCDVRFKRMITDKILKCDSVKNTQKQELF